VGGGGIPVVGAAEGVDPALAALGEKTLSYEPGVESQLLKISARQIDRRLREHKKKAGRRLYGRTKPGSLLKHHVPIKTDRWNVERPGVLRGGRDSVHSGSSLQERRQRPHRAEELDPRPQTHGVGSLRHGDIKRHYDAARTPFARVLECKEVRPMVVARLTALQKQLDPFALSRSVDVQLDRIHALANHVRSPSPRGDRRSPIVTRNARHSAARRCDPTLPRPAEVTARKAASAPRDGSPSGDAERWLPGRSRPRPGNRCGTCIMPRAGLCRVGLSGPRPRRWRGCGARHNQSPSRKASSESRGRNRVDLTPKGAVRAKARSFIVRSASRYICVVSTLSCPSHSAMTARSTPA